MIEANNNRLAQTATLTVFLVAVCLNLCFPGDAPWINDEPMLFIKALTANKQGELAATGLLGSFGLHYPPIIVWIYQFALLLTRNIIWIAFGKMMLVWTVLAGTLCLLQRRTRLNSLALLLVPLSPYIWLYNRMLWDNVFLIPASALLLLGLTCFLQRPGGWNLGCTAGVSVFMFLVHPISTPVILAVCLTMLSAQWRWLKSRWIIAVTTIVASLAVTTPFLIRMMGDKVVRHAMHVAPLCDRAAGGLLGARIFSHMGFAHFLPDFYAGRGPIPQWLTTVLLGTTFLVFISFALGIGRAMKQLIAACRRRSWSWREQLSLCGILVLLFMTAFFILAKATPLGHYYNAAWVFYFYFVWLGFSSVRSRIARGVVGIQLAAMGALLIFLVIHVHVRGGNRTWYYGPTLTNQLQAVRKIAPHFPKCNVEVQRGNWRKFKHAMQVLIVLELLREKPHAATTPASFRVDYRAPDSAWMKVQQIE